MKRSGVWDAWLLIVAVGMTAFGISMALLNRSPVFEGFNARIDPVFWRADQLDSAVVAFRGWVYGVWGATVAGFGLLTAFVVLGPYRRREHWARNALLAAIGLWFVIDTALSAAYRVWFNVGFNIAILIAVAIPVVATWRQFPGKSVPG